MENAAIQPAAACESGPRQWCNTAEQAPSECALDSAVASERLAVGYDDSSVRSGCDTLT